MGRASWSGGGGGTRTRDLRGMNPVSYQLLHPAIWRMRQDSNLRTTNAVYALAGRCITALPRIRMAGTSGLEPENQCLNRALLYH